MKEKLLGESFALCNEVFVYTLLRSENMDHRNLCDSLEFMNEHCKVRGVKDIFNDGLKGLLD